MFLETYTQKRSPRSPEGRPILLLGTVAMMLFSFSFSPTYATPPGYPSINDIETAISDAETNYPSICKRLNLGTSGQGRTMWALRISDNVNVEEDEPEFRYISSMHGDEVTGVVMCLNLIDELTTNYGVDSRITSLVDDVEIWIMPLMNPDGYVLNQRGNANGIDLNRNFPDPYTSPSNSTAGRQAETANIMNWVFAQSFTLAANYHGGELVANYPLDTNPAGASVYTASPDDDVFIYMSEEYSRTNLPMWNSGSFFHGITNGADWYAINGGMQDWSYLYQGTKEITIEVSSTKTPSFSQMPTFWNDNRESMLAFMETCLMGVRGLVTDVNTSLPIAATVRVVGRSHDVFTDPDVGDYHRMLLAGVYDIEFSAPGYDTMTAESVSVSAGSATRVDVALGPPAVLAAPDGGEMLAVGTATTVSWSGSSQVAYQVQTTANYGDTTIDADDFETGSLGASYTTGGNASWSVVGGTTHGGSFAARAGTIGDNQSTWMTRTVDGGTLSFWYQVSSESGWDYFDFSIDGDLKLHESGTSGGWVQYVTSLPVGGSYVLRWEYIKDGSVSNGSDTAWIDDVEVTVDNTTWADINSLTPIGATSTGWMPGVATTTGKVRTRAVYAANMVGSWDESSAVFTVEQGVPAIPAMSDWGVAVFLLLTLTTGTVVFRRAVQRDCLSPHLITRRCPPVTSARRCHHG